MHNDNRFNEQDDDLKIVDHAPQSSETADDALNSNGEPQTEYKLQQSGPLGLMFVPESSQTGAYSLKSPDDYEPEADISTQLGSTSDAPTVVPTSTDVYALAEEPKSDVITDPSELKKRREALDSPPQKPRRSGSKKHFSRRKDNNYDENEECSLEEIYERKRREREISGDGFIRGKRALLPSNPFWDGILHPFLSFNTLFRLGLVSAAAFIPLLAATIFFTRTLAAEAQIMLQNNQELGALTAFTSCLWRDKIIFLLFCFSWGIFSTPYSFHIFTETASGADEFNDWPEYSFLGGLGQFLWICCLITIGGLPGVALFSIFHLQPVVGFALSATALVPIFFLSCMQTDSLFTLITRDVFKSLNRTRKSWGIFFGIAYSFLFGTLALSLFAIWFDLHNYVAPNVGEKPGLGKVFITAAFLSSLLSFVPALYLRFLGRLAWVIEDDIRKNAKDEVEDSDIDNSI